MALKTILIVTTPIYFKEKHKSEFTLIRKTHFYEIGN